MIDEYGRTVTAPPQFETKPQNNMKDFLINMIDVYGKVTALLFVMIGAIPILVFAAAVLGLIVKWVVNVFAWSYGLVS